MTVQVNEARKGDDATLHEMAAAGASSREIATAIGARLGWVQDWARRHGIVLARKTEGVRAVNKARARLGADSGPAKPASAEIRHGLKIIAALDARGDVARLTAGDLRRGVCHWPVGDPCRPGFGYCGLEAGARRYCADHHALAYSPARAPVAQARPRERRP